MCRTCGIFLSQGEISKSGGPHLDVFIFRPHHTLSRIIVPHWIAALTYMAYCFSLLCRCACFYGPACPGSLDNPCQPYELPPAIPTVYTLHYNGKETTCSPMGCHDTYVSGRQLLNLTEHKKRDDTYEKVWSAIFVLPGNVSGFDQVSIFS